MQRTKPAKQKIRGVFSTARKEKAEKRKRNKELFATLYDNVKDYKFKPVNQVNMERKFFFPKFIGDEGFEEISKAALAVYPVLCSLSDFEKRTWIQISLRSISKAAGISVNTVRAGIDDLCLHFIGYHDAEGKFKEFPLLEKKQEQRGSRIYNLYRAGFMRSDYYKQNQTEGLIFSFHTCIIELGVWRKLTLPRAKPLYLAMRTFSKFNLELYARYEVVEGYHDRNEGDKLLYSPTYSKRKWEYLDMSLGELCRHVNISPKNIKPVVQQLEENGLINQIRDGLFQVFLKPQDKI